MPGVWQELRPYLVWKLLRVEEMWNRPVDLYWAGRDVAISQDRIWTY